MTNVVGECVLWQGARGDHGYGTLTLGGRTMLAHRVAYEQARGPIEPGMQVDHLCRVRACVKVEHLEVVTQRENILRGTSPAAIHARKTHCDHGHEFTPSNTYRAPSRTTKRICRACSAESTRRRNAARRAARAVR